jgi:transposase
LLTTHEGHGISQNESAREKASPGRSHRQGRLHTPSACCADSQSIKTVSQAEEVGCDGHKKIKGRKRYILSDTLGLIVVVVVTAAHTDDRLALVLKQTHKIELEVVEHPGKGFYGVQHRWKRERTSAWLGNDRRYSRDYELLTANSEAMIHDSALTETTGVNCKTASYYHQLFQQAIAFENFRRLPMTAAAKLLAILALTGSLLGGCMIRDDFTALSTKNVNLSKITLDPSELKGRQRGEECRHVFIVIPDTFHTPSMKGAVDKALEAKDANLLLNPVIEYQLFIFPLIFSRECWIAEGDAYDTYK